jgi:hypothetical protein
MTLGWFLFGGVPLRISAFLLVPFDSVGGVRLGVLLIHSGVAVMNYVHPLHVTMGLHVIVGNHATFNNPRLHMTVGTHMTLGMHVIHHVLLLLSRLSPD